MNTLLRQDTLLSGPSPSFRPWLRQLVVALLVTPAGLAFAQGTPASPPSEAAAPVANSNIDAALFYQLLVGEMNARIGDAGAGYSLVLDAARRQRDESLYRRAVEIALQARSGDSALAAAQAWSKALPESTEADRFTLQILLALNRPGETAPVLRSVLERAPAEERDELINAIPQTYARVTDKAVALRVTREALAPLLERPAHAAAAWTTIGRLELALGQPAQALTSARKAQAANAASPFPALLALELMERGQAGAEALVQKQLQTVPLSGQSSGTVALTYARVLLDSQRNAEARRLLEQLTLNRADLPEPWLLLATLQIQDSKTLEAGKRSLQTYMTLAREADDERSQRGLTQAYLLMAQVAEKQSDIAGANAWLDRIENAEEIMAAQMRRASLLARQGQMDKARALLRSHTERRPEDARLKLMAEAQLLREFKSWQAAYEVYGEAVARFPKDLDLLYDQAMMAEKANRLDAMERLLRQLMLAKPDHYHAFNALGYSLADRNMRLPEAKALIEKAVALAPEDAYIQDSLGWVEFRMGNIPRALNILQAAYQKKPDAEIAAHLGEVLWTAGQREQALKIWREGLLLASDNETLQSTLRRLRVQP